jgi:hypothetical protein
MSCSVAKKLLKKILKATVIVLVVFIIMEIGVRIIIDLPAKTDFYGSIKKEDIEKFQKIWRVKASAGSNWIHLGWIADPDHERYTIYIYENNNWRMVGETEFGSYLVRHLTPQKRYRFRISSGTGKFDHTISTSTIADTDSKIYIPAITSDWQPLFRPKKKGSYINDHTIFRTHNGKWHLIGITSFGEGDYSREFYFAHGVADSFPPVRGRLMREVDRVADYGHLAWAPHVIAQGKQYYMWFSPHRGYLATSRDGYTWKEDREHTFLPFNPQFRDPMLLRVAEDQWLMYVTARSGYYSSVDIYQSFDLLHWQYIGPAITLACGCERAGAQASTESPFVIHYRGRFYLSFTYNNDSFFWNPILLTMKIWLDRESYNETLVFQSDNPYDFGVYRGRHRPSSLVAILKAHAPEYFEHEGQWYITTGGWPWISSITSGEAAYARIEWKSSGD